MVDPAQKTVGTSSSAESIAGVVGNLGNYHLKQVKIGPGKDDYKLLVDNTL